MKVRLKLGRSKVDVNLPESAVLAELPPSAAPVSIEVFEKRLAAVLDSRRRDYSSVAIAVADKTRLCGYPEFLPAIVSALERRGARHSDIAFFIAYGTHGRQSDSESQTCYGSLYTSHRFIHHDCLDSSAFVEAGTTPHGTPIRLRSDFLSATLKISFGAVSHHYFAGFGGGRKLVFPGLGEREAIHHNHSLFLNRSLRRLEPGCQLGLLDGNPLAEDIRRCAEPMGVDIEIHGILDADGKVLDLLPGSGWQHFVDVCSSHSKCLELKVDGDFDLVVASCGGHPKDINFIQAHKSIHHAAAFAKNGGILVVMADCPDGIASNSFLPWFKHGRATAFDILAKHYEGNGGTALSMMEKAERLDIRLLTSLSSEICASICVSKLSCLGELDELARRFAANGGRILVVPNASCAIRHGHTLQT